MTTDRMTVQIVVVALAAVALSVVIGGVVLAYQSKAIPDALIALGSAAVGAIGALLARTGTEAPSPMPVVVQNEADEAVPVDTKAAGKKA